MFGTTPAFSSLSAPDIGAMRTFYGDILGLQVHDRPEGVELILAGGTRIFIYQSGEYHAPEHTVLNFLVDDIDKAVAALQAKGVSMEQYPDFHTDAQGICRNDGVHPGPKAIAWFKDPAAHILSVIQEK